ncbi:MAG: hypothetical protein HY884_01230, partial [Deltaproteobacteria bacterium]|nr:hypothetical protein [Deltaproteobacteria bacterium]
ARVEARQLLNGSCRIHCAAAANDNTVSLGGITGDKLTAKHRSTTSSEPIRTLDRKGKKTRSYSWVYLKSKPDDLTKGTFPLCA